MVSTCNMVNNIMLRCLFLTGGGVWGAIQPKILKNIAKSYDHIYGCSIGAINGAYIAQYQKSDFNIAVANLFKLWETGVLNNTINYNPYKLYKYSVNDNFFIKDMIEKNITNINNYDSTKPVFHCPVTNMECGSVEIYNNNSSYKNYTNDILLYILASASLPILFPFIKINNKYYSDGGILKYISKFDFEPLLIDKTSLEIDIIHTRSRDWKLHIDSDKYNDNIVHNISNLVRILSTNARYNDEIKLIKNFPTTINNYYIVNNDDYNSLVAENAFYYDDIIKKIQSLDYEIITSSY